MQGSWSLAQEVNSAAQRQSQISLTTCRQLLYLLHCV